MRLIVLLFLLVFPSLGAAQDVASLVADSITVDPSGRVTATGNVEVFYNGTRLSAGSVSYDRNGDQLSITGPIRVTDGSGTLLLADQAQLDRSLQDGVLVSARMVLDEQLQIAASEIARFGDRYTRLDQVVASSCEVCASNPTPLWEIRAGRVIHDGLERQLYFENAQFRVAGVPVLYLPRLRLPDPTVKRSTGVLIPQFTSSSDLGLGLKIPYFVAINDHSDLTLTPYISTSTTTLEFGYRHLLEKGSINMIGAATKDDIDGSRGYIFANAEYRLPREFLLSGQLEFVSDPGYLFTYDYSEKDRLVNQIALTRVRDKDQFRLSLSEFRTLRESEIPIRGTLPDSFLELFYQREIPRLAFGGRTFLTVGSTALERPSSDDVLGRDVNRLTAALDWRRAWKFGPGLLAATELGLQVDAYTTAQDSNFDDDLTRVVPRGAAELRWPHQRRTQDGGREVLEPIVRIDYSDTGGDTVPIEDSTVVEFDEANLFSPSRYPGRDGAENGLRVAVGAAWHREDPDGWKLSLALGRVANLSGDLGFGEGSGLVGDRSEWLLSGRFDLDERLAVSSRSLFDTGAEFTLSETRLDWTEEDFAIGTSYIYAVPEPSEGRIAQLSEWSLEGRAALNDAWSLTGGWRYDFTANRAARLGIGATFQTECVDMSLSLSRRFADSTSVDPITEYGFRVSLTGVSGRDANRGLRRRCLN